MHLPKLNSLYGRIFAIFWFTMLLILIVVLLLPNLDPRKARDLPNSERQRLTTIKENLETRFTGEQDLTLILRTLSDQFIRQPRRNMHQRLLRENQDKPHLFLTDMAGNILMVNGNQMISNRILQNFITGIDSVEQPQQRLYGHFLMTGPMPIHLARQPLLLYVAFPDSQLPPLFIRLLDHPVSLLLVVMLISTPLLLWLAWALSQPAQKLAQASQRVAQGEFQIDRSLEQGTTEFRQAGQSFNHMVGAVNEMISGQQRLLSDISHELRSPLTRLRMATALATRKQGAGPELERIDTEAQRLEQMIGELLELSRMQLNSHSDQETQPLSSLWETLLEDAVFEAEQMTKTLTYSTIPERYISGNPQQLMSAVENIVRNAIYYGKDQIRITFSDTPQQLTLCVEDNGEGVPDDELANIFRPFYRVSTTRERHSGGTGLGLAITENAIRQHRGTIQASRSTMGGLMITITLPLDMTT
ncbi:envelope stress sensor histidine kinase CpxA [Vibrio gazogenes]|uniref:histidine kinase n=1 Tax=Vibrio gazogenes DSM 21264 = NBRC 103151 TaxID=1123492 RepID=A0A1M5D5N5_VIBGA|nr:envelope stress sensor histidine kinase CpxA [Vibrio gazogenes]USP13955.1 envelope stress sensor histidine kinase CpxA [Vibrio gazogenes]SHF61992.1 two-component system, OmpR family, sensor histidine kinase CpxA [Vibrio gazogenes DSM 21264] [Vibrio gazogenes DSM 21264 = NBRC 103151]SJN54972.1 Sensor protein CpxA [Vibrio gazogenes]